MCSVFTYDDNGLAGAFGSLTFLIFVGFAAPFACFFFEGALLAVLGFFCFAGVLVDAVVAPPLLFILLLVGVAVASRLVSKTEPDSLISS